MARNTVKAFGKSTPPRSPLAERAHRQADSKFWQPEKPGDSVEGEVVSIKPDMGSFGSTHWHLRPDDGTVVVLSAAPQSVLGQKLAGEHLAVGDRIFVEFIGEKISKGGATYKNWVTASEKSSSPPIDDDEVLDAFAGGSR